MSAAVDTAIRTKLAAITNVATLAPGGVWNAVRPQGSQFPVIVYQLVSDMGNAQTYADGGVERLVYDVRVIAPIDKQASVGGLVDSVHDALERVALSVTGKTHLATLRQRRLPVMMEVSGGVTYLTRGATYEVTVTA